jgi:hypothetical protein
MLKGYQLQNSVYSPFWDYPLQLIAIHTPAEVRVEFSRATAEAIPGFLCDGALD